MPEVSPSLRSISIHQGGAEEDCPKCRGRVKRLFGTGAGLIFKGSGFYITDYRKPSYSEGARKESGAATTPTSVSNSNAAKTGGSKAPTKKD